MKPEELKHCLKRLGISPGSLQKLIGCTDLRKVSPEQARCIRAMVLHHDVRAAVMHVREYFPEAAFTGIRAI